MLPSAETCTGDQLPVDDRFQPMRLDGGRQRQARDQPAAQGGRLDVGQMGMRPGAGSSAMRERAFGGDQDMSRDLGCFLRSDGAAADERKRQREY